MKIEAEGFHTGPLTEGDELNMRIVKKFNNDKEFIDAIKDSPVFDYLHRINNYAGDVYEKYYPKEYKITSTDIKRNNRYALFPPLAHAPSGVPLKIINIR